MNNVSRPVAAWRAELTDKERSELELAERVRDAASEQLRNLTSKLKGRCIKRLHRKVDRNKQRESDDAEI